MKVLDTWREGGTDEGTEGGRKEQGGREEGIYWEDGREDNVLV